MGEPLMATIEERIAAVVGWHWWMPQIWDKPSGCGAVDCNWVGDSAGHIKHVAEMVAAELNLTEERHTYDEQEVSTFTGGTGAFSYGGQCVHSIGWRTDRRYVTTWERA